MGLPDFLCHKTIRWLAQQQRTVAESIDVYIADHSDLATKDFELLAQYAHNRAAFLNGLAITVERNK